MTPSLPSFYLAMLFSSNIWAVYGVGLDSRAANDSNCTTCIIRTTAAMHTSILRPQASPFQTPQSASYASTASTEPTHSPNIIFDEAPTTNNFSTNSFASLSTSAKAGIIIGISVFFLGIFLILFELGYLRRKRRERALQSALEEVERGGGIEMRKRAGTERIECSESKENMVLESRVEIVVDDGDEESDGDDVWVVDMEDEDRGRGRQAMSLPRREY